MKELISKVLGGSAAVVILIAMILFAPMLALWAINTLAAAGGSSFYIEHSLFNYLVAIVLLMLVRGG